MRTAVLVLLSLLCFSLVSGDVYMHNMRGSNNRLNEANTNRNNNNRMCDTQNNAKGGYAYGPAMYFYVGSKLDIEWTNQHSCGPENPNAQCQIILQYMCGEEVRDGITTDTIPDDVNQYNAREPNPDPSLYFSAPNPNNTEDGTVYRYGMHESYQYYQDCKQRSRNKGLFVADQNPGGSARSTRQNPGGGRSGFECPEERDYYPYWHPTPWVDIAVLTDDTGKCGYYSDHSENNRGRHYCTVNTFNNEGECVANAGLWEKSDSHGGSFGCEAAPYGRDNHLGNSDSGAEAAKYSWFIPDRTHKRCVLRLRYNISSTDYDGWDTYADQNAAASPIYDDPYVDFAGRNLSLAIDTSQFGRTFQDRSYVFEIRSRGSVGDLERIHNCNVRGKRGNIVQVYPAVEYDFIPTQLDVREGDRIHFQWTGSEFNPQGNDGEGKQGTDVSNLVVMDDRGENYPKLAEDSGHFLGSDERYRFAHLDQVNCSTLDELIAKHGNDENAIERDPTNCAKLNAASGYFDGGMKKMTKGSMSYHYMSTRNNNFTNRSQKGTIYVTPFLPIWAIVIVVFSGVVCLAALGLAVVGFIARFKEETALGKVWKSANSL